MIKNLIMSILLIFKAIITASAQTTIVNYDLASATAGSIAQQRRYPRQAA